MDYYTGLDVHKPKISYCVKDGGGKVFAEGRIPATGFDLDRWMKRLPRPWSAALEATMFSCWIYDHLKPHAAALKVAHPLMLRAIAAANKKNESTDGAASHWKYIQATLLCIRMCIAQARRRQLIPVSYVVFR